MYFGVQAMRAAIEASQQKYSRFKEIRDNSIKCSADTYERSLLAIEGKSLEIAIIYDLNLAMRRMCPFSGLHESGKRRYGKR